MVLLTFSDLHDLCDNRRTDVGFHNFHLQSSPEVVFKGSLVFLFTIGIMVIFQIFTHLYFRYLPGCRHCARLLQI